MDTKQIQLTKQMSMDANATSAHCTVGNARQCTFSSLNNSLWMPSNFSSLKSCQRMPMYLQLTEQLSMDANAPSAH
ncbi:hypothetical protein J6590_088109 [Homalodisca vitripennis]|nr:hypothetical protein J6590_088109 [Homalodisca vitripennis]